MTAWHEMSAAGFDRSKMDRRHKPAADGQDSQIYVPTPARAPKPKPGQQEMPGQVDLFGLPEIETGTLADS